MFRHKKNLIWAGLVFVACLGIYLQLLMPGIYAGDSGDVVTASYVLGVAHPPGYPLYCLLGNFFSKLPFGSTVAWRYSLFSAFFSSLALALFFLGLKFLTKRTIPSLAGTFVLAFSYPFWLYSEVQEVFSLLAFFVVFLVVLGLVIERRLRKKKFEYKLFYLWFFLIGLSLTHHHTVLLLVPGFFYLLWPFKKKILRKKSFLVKLLIFFILGLSVYIYVPLAAHTNPPINWNNASNLRNFVRLVGREDYGTFQLASRLNLFFWQRLYQIKLYLKLIMADFTIFGAFLMFLGAVFLFFKKRRLFCFLMLSFLFLGPVFLFYANFPLRDNFTIGVFERFLIAPNIFLVIFLSFGVYVFGQSFKNIYEGLLKRKFNLLGLVEGFCFLLCLILFWQNFKKVDFRGNMIGSFYAEDLLKTAEKNSIVFLSGDIPLFNSQYLYFVERYRSKELILTSGSRFGELYIIDYIKKNYPQVYVPQKGEDFRDKFLDENSKKFPIYSNIDLEVKSGLWVPVGLLFKYYSNQNEVKIDDLLSLNDKAWEAYHNYQELPGSTKSSLFLKNIGSTFAGACARVGRYFFDEKRDEVAQKYFGKGIEFDPEFLENYKLLGMAQFNLKNCQEAEKNYSNYMEKAKGDEDIYFLMGAIYRYCKKDEGKAKFYDEIYEKMKKESGLKLEKL